MTRICLGVIIGVHGLRGRVRIKSFTARPEDVGAYGPLADESGARSFHLRKIEVTPKGVVLASVDGITERAAAETLKGTRLHVAREALPPAGEDEYYHADLVGLVVETLSGAPLGRIASVQDFGAGDLLEVVTEEGKTLMLPFTRAVVPVVDLAGGRVVADPPAGLAGERPDGKEGA